MKLGWAFTSTWHWRLFVIHFLKHVDALADFPFLDIDLHLMGPVRKRQLLGQYHRITSAVVERLRYLRLREFLRSCSTRLSAAPELILALIILRVVKDKSEVCVVIWLLSWVLMAGIVHIFFGKVLQLHQGHLVEYHHLIELGRINEGRSSLLFTLIYWISNASVRALDWLLRLRCNFVPDCCMAEEFRNFLSKDLFLGQIWNLSRHSVERWLLQRIDSSVPVLISQLWRFVLANEVVDILVTANERCTCFELFTTNRWSNRLVHSALGRHVSANDRSMLYRCLLRLD